MNFGMNFGWIVFLVVSMNFLDRHFLDSNLGGLMHFAPPNGPVSWMVLAGWQNQENLGETEGPKNSLKIHSEIHPKFTPEFTVKFTMTPKVINWNSKSGNVSSVSEFARPWERFYFFEFSAQPKITMIPANHSSSPHRAQPATNLESQQGAKSGKLGSAESDMAAGLFSCCPTSVHEEHHRKNSEMIERQGTNRLCDRKECKQCFPFFPWWYFESNASNSGHISRVAKNDAIST